MKTTILTLFFLLTAVPALGCGDAAPVNMVATPAVKAGLVAAYRAAHPQAPADGPVSGHTWYGRLGDFQYAVATFDGVPRVFTRHRTKRWLLALDTNGTVCARVVPSDLLSRTWWWRNTRADCFVEPG